MRKQELLGDRKYAFYGMLLMIVVFTVLYFIRSFDSNTTKYRFGGASLEMTRSEDYGAIYTGKVRNGRKARFTVTPGKDKTVLFQIDQDTYGPFRISVRNLRVKGLPDFEDVHPLDVYVGDKCVLSGGYSKKLSKVYLKTEEYPGLEADTFETADGTEYSAVYAADLYLDKDYNARTTHYGSTAPSVSELAELAEGLPRIEKDYARLKAPMWYFLGVWYSLVSAYGIYMGKRWTGSLAKCILRGLAFFLLGLL